MQWGGIHINHIERYFHQIESQTNLNQNEIGFFLLEGDSKDNTADTLKIYASERNNVKIFHQSATYGMVTSTDDPNRIASVSRLGTRLINEAKEHCQYVMFVESDLIMPDNLISTLLSDIEQLKAGIVAPIAMLYAQNIFYDTWAFRNLDDSRWQGHHPFSHVIDQYERFIPMKSVGSCAIIDGEALRKGANFNEGAFVELCNNVRSLGYEIYADKLLRIWHPSSSLVNGRWV
jgi:GT2 family glycosyltransferase